jgi:hypothetical protein
VHGINGGSGSQFSVNSATRSGGGRGNSDPSGGGQRGRGRNSQGGRGRNQGGRGCRYPVTGIPTLTAARQDPRSYP